MAEKNKLYDIGDAEVKLVWELHPQETVESMEIQLQFHALRSKIPMSKLLAKWAAYIDLCKKEDREDKYIKRFKNFMDEGMYLHEFVYNNRSGNIAKAWLEGLP